MLSIKRGRILITIIEEVIRMYLEIKESGQNSILESGKNQVINLFYTYESLNSCSCSDAGLFMIELSEQPIADYTIQLDSNHPEVYTNKFSLTFMEEEMQLIRDKKTNRLILTGNSGVLSPNVSVRV